MLEVTVPVATLAALSFLLLIPVQAQAEDLVLLSSRSYYKPDSSFGTGENELHVIGEIMNNSSDVLGPILIVASFYDGAGALVGSTYVNPTITVLGPGERSPFEIIVGGLWGELAVPVMQVRSIYLSLNLSL
jgi:hypothetical protein